MRQRRIAAILALLVVCGVACGKYGPPVRARKATPAAASAPVPGGAPGTATVPAPSIAPEPADDDSDEKEQQP